MKKPNGNVRAPRVERIGPCPRPDVFGPIVECPTGSVLHRQGASVEQLVLIVQGLVKITRGVSSESDVVVGVRSANWLLGGISAVLARPHATTAAIATPSSVRHLAFRSFTELLESDPTFSAWVLRLIAQEYYDQMSLHGAIGLDLAEALERQLARFALEFGRSDDAGNIRLILPLKQHEIAQMFGVAPETASRAMTDMKRRGLFAQTRGQLMFLRGGDIMRRMARSELD